MTHTLGRLEIERTKRPSNSPSDYRILAEIDGEKYKIADVFEHVHFGLDLPAKANARRMVACWNALAGIPVEAIEAGIVGEMVEALRGFVRIIEADESGPDYKTHASNAHMERLLILQAWLDEASHLSDRVIAQARAVLSKLSPPTDRGEE